MRMRLATTPMMERSRPGHGSFRMKAVSRPPPITSDQRMSGTPEPSRITTGARDGATERMIGAAGNVAPPFDDFRNLIHASGEANVRAWFQTAYTALFTLSAATSGLHCRYPAPSLTEIDWRLANDWPLVVLA